MRSLTRNIADLRPLERELRGKLTPSGELKDDASPLLRRLRRESRDSYQAAAASVQSFVDSELGAQVLQDRLFTVRGERLVLPVKADFRGRAPGIVHGTSDSGATLFIEPFTSVSTTNRWREATDAEQEEVLRILRLLSASVGRRATEALHALEITARLDTALAKARYARTYNGVTCGGHTAGVSLVEARHPLLGGRAVPLSLTLRGADHDARGYRAEHRRQDGCPQNAGPHGADASERDDAPVLSHVHAARVRWRLRRHRRPAEHRERRLDVQLACGGHRGDTDPRDDRLARAAGRDRHLHRPGGGRSARAGGRRASCRSRHSEPRDDSPSPARGLRGGARARRERKRGARPANAPPDVQADDGPAGAQLRDGHRRERRPRREGHRGRASVPRP